MSDKQAAPLWSFRITNAEGWSSFRYVVKVYRDGQEVGDDRTSTLWGARYAARRIRRKVARREPCQLVAEGTFDGPPSNVGRVWPDTDAWLKEQAEMDLPGGRP